MDIVKSIQIFQQVAEDQSFTKAAESLGLVPSAVSRQISELENWLGVRLINRTTRSLHLTDDGHKYLERMATIISQVASLKALTIEEQSNLSGRVRLTTPMMLGKQIVSDLLAEFKREHPDVKFDLSLMSRKVDLIEDDYDLAIRAGNLSDSSFIARRIGDVSFKTVASANYLKNSPSLKAPKDLSEHNCIINSTLSNSKRWSYKVEKITKTIKVTGDIESNESACILSFAKAGFGVAVLPSAYVQEDLATGHLIEVLSDFANNPLPLNVIYPSNKLLNPTVRALIDFLVVKFKDITI